MAKRREDWRKAGVEVGPEVDLRRIAPDAVIHPGCRLRGEKLSIGPGCVIGEEGPATVVDCRLGRGVRLGGGFFSGAVFLDGARMGGNAHVRPGTLLEEEASGAHAVGLKQTILLPFVTLGSLINFCDVLMAGGTSRRDHSEVGSSYIHFNYTPQQDKATASLIGDVPRGVFLRERPVFLGGQGGLVGPARIAYGTVIAAGGVFRGDVTEENRLVVPEPPRPGARPFDPALYRRIGRRVRNNLAFIGNLLALRAWYRHVRSRFLQRDDFDRACLDGAIEQIEEALAERIRRLGQLAEKAARSADRLEAAGEGGEAERQRAFAAAWPRIERELRGEPREDAAARRRFVERLPWAGMPYIEAVRALDAAARAEGRAWLQSIVDFAENLWKEGDE